MAAITLNTNAIYDALTNMIISQHVFANPIGGLSSEIVDGNRVDGTLYGDQKSYISVNMIHPRDWGADSEATNLLQLERNTNIKAEEITLDVFKMFKLTTGTVKEKQAFMTEGGFSQFNAVQLGMIRDGKRAYDVTTYNTFVGTHGKALPSITVPQGANEALVLAQGVADVLDEMSELETTFNENGFLRAYGKSDVDIIFNKKYLNKWKYVDLPIVFHKDGVLGEHKEMNAKYFGAVPADATAAGTAKSAGTLRFAKQINTTSKGSFYAGDLVPSGVTVGNSTSGDTVSYEDTYVEDGKIVAIIVGKGAIPYMSACENSTAFWNPQSLTNTNFLIYGHNTLKALKEKPYVVIKKA